VLACRTETKFEPSFDYNTRSFFLPKKLLSLSLKVVWYSSAADMLDLRLGRFHVITRGREGDGAPCLFSRLLLHPTNDAFLIADRFGSFVGADRLLVAVSFTLSASLVLWHDAVFGFWNT
jgi:hypothetical protein